ncbi:mannitol dehydrogenase family protein [Streptomyces sp. NPDC050560]|uniref:mannitol dehydrogenase family protein n=1 Tax=Streptomyces sp. NPDC050560 TaxID=3365630 RepID=UPI0037B3A18D
MSRLNRALLARLAERDGLRLPDYDTADVGTGVVHLGLGAFHRAHQAVYTEDGLRGEDWGICAYTQRSDAAARALAPQDGLYTVVERGAQSAPPRVVGVLREARCGVSDPVTAPERIADPAIRVVTLTVTERGYRLTPSRRLDVRDPLVARDAALFDAPGHRHRTVAGQLAAALHLRRVRGGAPLTVVPCDNVPGNGRVVRAVVDDFCALLPHGAALSEWIDGHVAFPSTVVDRIVPAATPADRRETARRIGADDLGTVVCEPYRQWVVEDSFAAPRPHWEDAGATLTDDVHPYEAVKLRMLNAAHSLVACTGALAGHPTIAAALDDPRIAEAARQLMACDAAPSLRAPHGLDLTVYQETVLDRFRNPALGHTTAQVATDGSVKIPIRLLGTVEDRLAAGAEPHWAALAVAAWMVLIGRGTDRQGRPLSVPDPLAGQLAGSGALLGNPAAFVGHFLAERAVFPAHLADDPVLRRLLITHVRDLLR